MSAALVRALSAGDIDTVAQEGMRGRPDPEQLAAATARGRVLDTFNVRDYVRLHVEVIRGGGHHAGIVVVNEQWMAVGEQARRLLRLAESLTTETLADRIEYLGAWA